MRFSGGPEVCTAESPVLAARLRIHGSSFRRLARIAPRWRAAFVSAADLCGARRFPNSARASYVRRICAPYSCLFPGSMAGKHKLRGVSRKRTCPVTATKPGRPCAVGWQAVAERGSLTTRGNIQSRRLPITADTNFCFARQKNTDSRRQLAISIPWVGAVLRRRMDRTVWRSSLGLLK